jgi:hypothetical protein
MSSTAMPGALEFGPGAVCAAVTASLIVIAICMANWGWVPILDSANLVFHEAGHPIFGIFGDTLALYGGTLGQLVFPTVVAVSFWRRRQMMGAALGAVWFLENGLNIARYASDARAQELPLVGGGDHDWFNILYRWDALAYDVSIGRTITVLCWMGLMAVWVAAFWRWQFPK